MPRKPGGIVANLRAWYADSTGRVMLTPQEETQYQRIRQAWALLSDVTYPRTTIEIVNILRREYGVERRSAYETIGWAKELYGEVTQSDAAATREIIYNLYLEAYRVAHKQGDNKGMIAAAKGMQSIKGLDKDNADIPDLSKIDPGETILAIKPEEFKQIAMLIDGGVINLNRRIDAEEIEYEPVESGHKKSD